MPVKDCQTEKRIHDAAMKIFFTEGRLNATTQEIADAAGVNRTLINYHYKSRDALFASILQNGINEIVGRNESVMLSDLPFREKTEKFIDNFMDSMERHPYLEPFLTLDIIQKRLANSPKMLHKEQPPGFKRYIADIQEEINAGRINYKLPAHFLMNLLSLIVYPFITKPLQMSFLDVNEQQYDEMLKDRKQVILSTIFFEDCRLKT
jgi:AcrR family transcriptional regulator